MRGPDYTPDQQRVVDYIWNLSNEQIGGGDDPIGFLIASHAFSRQELKRKAAPAVGDLPAILTNLRKWADVLDIPSGRFVNEDIRLGIAILEAQAAELDELNASWHDLVAQARSTRAEIARLTEALSAKDAEIARLNEVNKMTEWLLEKQVDALCAARASAIEEAAKVVVGWNADDGMMCEIATAIRALGTKL